MRRRESRLDEAPINLTPLIDVVFVILIMFIVIAPLLEMDQVDLAQGENHHLPAKMAQNLVIRVLADETMSFNNRPISLEQLKGVLAHAKRRFPTEHPQLFYDQKASFGTYQAVKNAAEHAGFEQLDVLLKP